MDHPITALLNVLAAMPDHSPEWLENPSVRVQLRAAVIEARVILAETRDPATPGLASLRTTLVTLGESLHRLAEELKDGDEPPRLFVMTRDEPEPAPPFLTDREVAEHARTAWTRDEPPSCTCGQDHENCPIHVDTIRVRDIRTGREVPLPFTFEELAP